MSSVLRQAARGRPCQVRLPGICNHNPETTVLAHIRIAGLSGVGMKPPDTCGVHCCSACHDALDGRTKHDLGADVLRGYVLDGLLRTLVWLESEGYIKAQKP